MQRKTKGTKPCMRTAIKERDQDKCIISSLLSLSDSYVTSLTQVHHIIPRMYIQRWYPDWYWENSPFNLITLSSFYHQGLGATPDELEKYIVHPDMEAVRIQLRAASFSEEVMREVIRRRLSQIDKGKHSKPWQTNFDAEMIAAAVGRTELMMEKEWKDHPPYGVATRDEFFERTYRSLDFTSKFN